MKQVIDDSGVIDSSVKRLYDLIKDIAVIIIPLYRKPITLYFKNSKISYNEIDNPLDEEDEYLTIHLELSEPISLSSIVSYGESITKDNYLSNPQYFVFKQLLETEIENRFRKYMNCTVEIEDINDGLSNDELIYEINVKVYNG